MIESLVGLLERLAHGDRKAETLLLDQCREVRQRRRIRPKKRPCVILRALGQSSAVSFLFGERPQCAAHPAIPIKVSQHRMHCRGMAESPIPQAADERKIIVPCGEVERRVESAAKRRERLRIAIKNFGGARLQTSSQRFRPRDGGDVGSPG